MLNSSNRGHYYRSRGKSGQPIQPQRSSQALNSDLNNVQNAAGAQEKVAVQRNTAGFNQTQKFSFGHGPDLPNRGTLSFQNLQVGGDWQGKPCQTAREPVARTSCLQNFTQRHLEGQPRQPPKHDGSSFSLNNEGHILTFRGSRQNNESRRESIQTDRQHLQQTTFGNLGTGRGKASPATGDNSDQHKQSMTLQTSTIPRVIQSDRDYVQNEYHSNMQTEGNQLDHRRIDLLPNMGRYLEDHTNTDGSTLREDEQENGTQFNLPSDALNTMRNPTAAPSKDNSILSTRIKYTSMHNPKSHLHSQTSSGTQWNSHSDAGTQAPRSDRGIVGFNGLNPPGHGPEAAGSGRTSNPTGKNSVVSYHISNKSNSSHQHHPSYLQPAALRGAEDGFEVKYSEGQRLETFVVHGTTHSRPDTSNRTSFISSSLADVRSKFQVGGESLPPPQQEQFDQFRARMIDTVYEQDESSTASNVKHVLQQSTTSQQNNHDMSNHRHNSKNPDGHGVSQLASAFQQAAGSQEGVQPSPARVLDQERSQVIPRPPSDPIQPQYHGEGQVNETMPLWQSNLCQIQKELDEYQMKGRDFATENSMIAGAMATANRAHDSRDAAAGAGSQMTSHFNSQDFNEFNSNEITTDHDVRPSNKLMMETCMGSNLEDEIAEEAEEEASFHQVAPEEVGSSVPNAYRKVVHQPDSQGPPTASSGLTENHRSATEQKDPLRVGQLGDAQLGGPFQGLNAANPAHYYGGPSTDESQIQMKAHDTPQHYQESEQTFLRRSYLKNISLHQSGTKEKKPGNATDDFREEHDQEINEDTQSTISHSRYLQGAMGYSQCTVPRNQNAIVYDTVDAMNFQQVGPKSIYPQQQTLQRTQNRIERSPLNEKVLIEELINNGFANHDGSQAKVGSAGGRANLSGEDAAANQEQALDRTQTQKNEPHRLKSIHEGSQKLIQAPGHQHTNTMMTTEGEYLENISEHVRTRPVSLNHQFNPEHQGKSKEGSSTDVADEKASNAALPQRLDVRHKPMMMELLRQGQFEPLVENRPSIRELLELPRDDPALPPGAQSRLPPSVKMAAGLAEPVPGQVAPVGVHGSFDVYRRVDGELQASPSRVMDDRQPGYNSRLEHLRDNQHAAPSDVAQDSRESRPVLPSSSVSHGQSRHSETDIFGKRDGGHPSELNFFYSEKTGGQNKRASKVTFNLTPGCRLVYSYKVYHQGAQASGVSLRRALTESYKIFNPGKPKLCWFKFTRISQDVDDKSTTANFEKVLALFKEKVQGIDCTKRWNTVYQAFSHLYSTHGLASPQDQILVDGQPCLTNIATVPRSLLDAYSSSRQECQTHRNNSRHKIHDMLYRQSELKRKKLEQRKKERETQVMQKEFDQCTFSPQPFKPDGVSVKRKEAAGQGLGVMPQYHSMRQGAKVSSEKMLLRNSASRVNPLSSSEKRTHMLKFFGSTSGKDSCQSEPGSTKLAPKIRSPETFFRDMMHFKDRREEKLNSIRKEQDSLYKSKSCVQSKRFSSTQDQDQFFENLSRAKPKMETSSKSININLKNLAQQSNVELFGGKGGQAGDRGHRIQLSPRSLDQRQEMVQRLDKRSRSNQVHTTPTRSHNEGQRTTSQKPLQQQPKRSEPSTHSNRNLSQRSEMLYQDHFLRQSRLKDMKAKTVRFQAQQNLTERSQPTHKSNQILANKIALNVKTEYDRIIEQMKQEVLKKRIMDKKKATDVVIEEKSGESELDMLASRRTGRSGTHEQWSQSTDFQPLIEGVDLQRFVQLLSRLHYLSDVNDQKIVVQERTAIRNAWQLISHRDPGAEGSPFPPDTPIANLRNLLIFLIGIENIFIESMACSQQQEEEITGQMSSSSASSHRHARQVGFFIGQNYFLRGEPDCLRLMQNFNLFVHNKLCHQRTHQQLANKEKLSIQKEQRDQVSFHPTINRKSEQIMLEKNHGLYTRANQSKADSIERYTYNASSARGTDHVTSQKQSKEQRLRKAGCKYEDFLISKGQQKKIKLQQLAKQVSRDQTKECTFTPQINKSTVVGVRGGRPIIKDHRSKSNKENQMSQTCIWQLKPSKEDVFESLYKFAEVRREKSEDGKRNAQFIEKKQLRKQCPFRPNLSKTQKINKSVNSKIYQYKEPDLSLLPGKDRLGQCQPGGLSALATGLISNRGHASPRGHQRGGSKKGLSTARSQVNIIQNNFNYTTVTDAFRDHPALTEQVMLSQSHGPVRNPGIATKVVVPPVDQFHLSAPSNPMLNTLGAAQTTSLNLSQAPGATIQIDGRTPAAAAANSL